MKRVFVLTAVLALLCLGTIAHASITIDTVGVGNAGNAADKRYSSQGDGSVAYNYNIGKYEVTAAQYTAFLNSVAATDTYRLYDYHMYMYDLAGCQIQRSGVSGSYTYSVAPDYANRPVNYVSFWDACRFANWLGNGQLTGAQDASTTESGAYTLNGYTGSDGRTIQRNSGATWAVASADEWYKAAYYDPDKAGGGGYWYYPTRSDIPPANQVLPTDPGNSANYYINSYGIGYPYYRTNVGEFENSASAYGTFDQGGNVDEIIETLALGHYRHVWGGFWGVGEYALRASSRGSYQYPDLKTTSTGFRVVLVPEPSPIVTLLGGLAGLLGMRRRRD